VAANASIFGVDEPDTDPTGYYRRAAAAVMAMSTVGRGDYTMVAIGQRRRTH
jgi:hypothetical protein